jgi:hypothetical protein
MDPLDFKFVDNLRPPCSKCGRPLILTRIEPEEPGFDLRTLQAGQGAPIAPHEQACVPSQGFSVWRSQTQPQPSHCGQVISIPDKHSLD